MVRRVSLRRRSCVAVLPTLVVVVAVVVLAVTGVTRPASAGHDTTCAAAVAAGTAIVGTSGPDVLVGTLAADVIVGLGGNDAIFGLGGDDRICPGTGNDVVDGGTGFPHERDVVDYSDHPTGVTADLQAGVVTSLYHSGSEVDTLVGIEGIEASPYADTITGTLGADVIHGKGGDDEISGLGNRRLDMAEVLSGGEGNDRIAAGLVGTFVAGLFEAYGWQHVDGGSGNDTIDAIRDTSHGVFWGGPGADTFVLSSDDDAVVGGGGEDTVSYEWAAADLTIDLAKGKQQTGAGEDSFESIENVRGGSGDDTLLGNNANNKLFGEDGDDVLDGRGNTADYANGGADVDTCTAETRVFCEA